MLYYATKLGYNIRDLFPSIMITFQMNFDVPSELRRQLGL
jgi:hypothetical protein